MQVIVKKTFRDIFTYNLRTTLRRPISIVFNCFMFIVLFMPCISYAKTETNITVRLIIVVNLAILILLALYIYWAIIVLLTLITRNNKLSYLETTLDFDEMGISERYEGGTGTYSWALIKNVKQTRKYFYIHLSATAALIIPKRVFTSKEEEESFGEFVKEHTQNKSNAIT